MAAPMRAEAAKATPVKTVYEEMAPLVIPPVDPDMAVADEGAPYAATSELETVAAAAEIEAGLTGVVETAVTVVEAEVVVLEHRKNVAAITSPRPVCLM